MGSFPRVSTILKRIFSLDFYWGIEQIENYDLIDDVKYMRDIISKVSDIEYEKNMLRKVILCKVYLSSNQWGTLLEKGLRDLFKLTKAKKKDEGDCVRNGVKMEIKVSLGDKKGNINFVQIRPDHNIDYYLLMVYNLNYGSLGKLHYIMVHDYNFRSIIILDQSESELQKIINGVFCFDVS